MLSGGTLKMQHHHQCTKNTMNSHPSNAEFAGLVDMASCRCNLDGGPVNYTPCGYGQRLQY